MQNMLLAHALCYGFNETKQSYVEWEEDVQIGADYTLNISKDGTEESKEYVDKLSIDTVLTLLQSGQGFIVGYWTNGCECGYDKYIVGSSIIEHDNIDNSDSSPIRDLIRDYEAELKQARNVYCNLYMMFVDDNKMHCEHTMQNNGMYDIDMTLIKQHLVDFITEIVTHGHSYEEIKKIAGAEKYIINENNENTDNFLYYMVDVDLCAKDYGVLETIKEDLYRSKSLEEARKFAKKYAKNRANFDFQYLKENEGDYYSVTIRKYYKEETETENGDWDDWDAIRVANPRKSKQVA